MAHLDDRQHGPTINTSSGFSRFTLSLPVLSDATLLVPAAVPESDLDFDELPAASSLLDA